MIAAVRESTNSRMSRTSTVRPASLRGLYARISNPASAAAARTKSQLGSGTTM
eukprot:CAMPEP_0185835646 /NCGR_PEP_ID=MMETSP1353-20130828/8182_1 /TAXON_ID=1077150 /ORGANISM="Erythrolobus australicus, Strain CCMP3124" /LENGTH=52 /DNA_ID=CAMNT_0028534309 /DNA_START=9 /DNA_END=164 /DNA_ORIENTATION=-